MNYFEQNLKVLEKGQPELVDLMRKERDTSHIEIMAAESGMSTARVIGPDGKHRTNRGYPAAGRTAAIPWWSASWPPWVGRRPPDRPLRPGGESR